MLPTFESLPEYIDFSEFSPGVKNFFIAKIASGSLPVGALVSFIEESGSSADKALLDGMAVNLFEGVTKKYPLLLPVFNLIKKGVI
jgi:hypothetical protein